MPDYETIQFHELNPASSVAAADVLAIDTWTTLLKLRADQMVMSVKGNAESSYRTGNVNLTPQNIGAVNKAGDTLTGQLNVKTDFDAHATHSAAGQFTPINFSDSTGNVIGVLRENYTAAGGYNLQIGSRDNSSGSALFNTMQLGFNENGNRTVALDEPVLWRNAMRLYMAVYTALSQLGLSSGTTILAVYNAMPDLSICYISAENFASSEVPATTGIVEIQKLSAPRAAVFFHGKGEGSGEYRMFCGATAYNGQDTNAPTGAWKKITMT